MKNIPIISIVFATGLLFLNSCEDSPWGCITGNNRIAIEERTIGAFSSIVSYSSFVVNVEIGESYSLSVEADENLLPYIKTSIQGNTLVLETRSDRCIRSNEPIIVNVVTQDLEKVKLAGSGVINANTLNSDELDLELSGSGKIECRRVNVGYLKASLPGSGIIELSGSAETCDFSLSGSGLIKGIELVTNRCYATISGSGNIYTFVKDRLEVTISGSGNLYYDGNPVIDQKITGSGNVRPF